MADQPPAQDNASQQQQQQQEPAATNEAKPAEQQQQPPQEEKKDDAQPAQSKSEPAATEAEPKPKEEPQPQQQPPAKRDEPSPKKQEPAPRRKSTSPDPDAPPPTYLRGTQASQHRASPSRPADKQPPPTVTTLAKMSAMERVKKEYNLKIRSMKHQMEKGVACFGASSPRGISPEQQHLSPQQQRSRAEQQRRQQARFKNGASLDSSDVAPVAAKTRVRPQPSWFSKSKISGDRHQFQRIWPARGFPLAAVQKVFSPAAPGPGAYADSVSFVRPCTA